MNVLMITPNYPSKAFPFAGIFQQMQAKALENLGIRPRIVSPIPYVPAILKKASERYKCLAEVPYHSWDGSIEVLQPRYLTTIREYALRFSHLTQRVAIANLGIDKPDLIHAHFAYPVGAAVSGLAKKWNIPSIITLHGDDVTIHPRVSRLHRWAFKKTVHGADEVISVSRTLADETERMTGRIPSVLSTGIRPDDFTNLPDKQCQRKKLGLPETAYVILYIGNMLVQKGVYDLAAAFKRLNVSAAMLIYVGDGPHKPMGDRITHFGTRHNHEIPNFLAVADVLVLPSYHEGLGQVILEAGAAALPVIGSATGGIINLLSESRGWMCPPKNITALTDCILQVFHNPKEAVDRARRLRDHVLVEHDVSKNTAKLMKIYQRLCCR